MKTQIVLSQADDRPIYVQIMDEIQQRVALGDWEPGLRLPGQHAAASATRFRIRALC